MVELLIEEPRFRFTFGYYGSLLPLSSPGQMLQCVLMVLGKELIMVAFVNEVFQCMNFALILNVFHT